MVKCIARSMPTFSPRKRQDYKPSPTQPNPTKKPWHAFAVVPTMSEINVTVFQANRYSLLRRGYRAGIRETILGKRP